MKFELNIAPWVNELESYLKNPDGKIGQLKSVLKNADFNSLSYADQSKLFSMFDPARDISQELLQRQLGLYFNLLESKGSVDSIPIFSGYIDWVLETDLDKFNDDFFDSMSKMVVKTKVPESNLPDSVKIFMKNLPSQFSKNIDKMSNERLSTLIDVLNALMKSLDNDFEKLPNECKVFIKNMFKACAVKAEISDRNKTKMNSWFKDDRQTYFNLFNKAFAGVDKFSTWIDEPAKKLSYPRMVDYANFQYGVAQNDGSLRFLYDDAWNVRTSMKLPKLHEYDGKPHDEYLAKPREYKNYAKRMSNLFEAMLKSDFAEIKELKFNDKVGVYDILSNYATTECMQRKMEGIISSSGQDDFKFLTGVYEWLIDMVHLDELTGKEKTQIYDKRRLRANVDDLESGRLLRSRLLNGQCTIDELGELYDLMAEHPNDYMVEQAIFDLELKQKELNEDD